MRRLSASPLALLTILVTASACGIGDPPVEPIGRFYPATDLFLAQFDVKTDVDDLHSVAGVATMLADPRFSEVRYHAVAGAYGMQEGLYVPADTLFEMAFGEHWSNAHADFDGAVDDVAELVKATLEGGGSVWIADAGQSDFSAAVVRSVDRSVPEGTVREGVHIVQHADWNEEVTTPEDLAYVKEAATYHRIPDGNTVGNGTPGFRSDASIDWRSRIDDPRLVQIWETAIDIANRYNGEEDRYLNTSIEQGGLDFSDVAETAWIFGFEGLEDGEAFFEEFGGR